LTNREQSDELLTAEDAFAVAFEFLSEYWRELSDATVGDVLSEMNPAYGGRTSDPAAWHDWLRAIERVRAHSDE
jgi:hypothetical protein